MAEQQRKPHPMLLIALLGSGLGIILAGLLVCKHVFPELCASSPGCKISGVDGCLELGKSDTSKILGIPIAGFGLFYYAFLFSLFLRLYRKNETDKAPAILSVLVFLAVFGLVVDGSLAYVNFTQLITPCLLCAYTYVCTLLIGIAVFVLYRAHGYPDQGFKDLFRGAMFLWPEFLYSAAGLVLFLGAMFFVSTTTSSPEDRDDKGMTLLPESEVSAKLSEFRQLTPATLSEAALVSYEQNGAADAKPYIIIHDFADFRCPHCFHASQTLTRALQRWPGRIKVYYRNFPLDGTCNPIVKTKQEGGWSCNGAQAALCATEQGFFPRFYHELYEFQTQEKMMNLHELQELTQKLGGNWERMKSCMGSTLTAARLENDIRDAQELKMNSTPTLVVAGHKLPSGAPDERYFLHLLDALVFEKEGAAAYQEFKNRGAGK